MDRPQLDARDKLFVAAVVVQLAVSAVLGVAVVKAINRSGDVQVVGAPSATPSAASQATAGPAKSGTTRTVVTGGSGGKAGAAGTVGVSAGEIKLGGLFTFSGPGDATPAYHAAQAYFNMVNRAGGVYGRRIVYVPKDDHFDPSQGFADVKELVENEKVFAMVSWVAPNTENKQTLDYLTERGIPFVGNFGQPPEYTSPISYSFTLNWTTSPALTVRMMAKTLGVKKIGFFWIHLSDQISQIVRSSATKEAQANGAEIVCWKPESLTQTGPGYASDALDCRDKGAEGLIQIMDSFSLKRYWSAFTGGSYRPKQLGYAFGMDPQVTNSIPAGYPDVYGMQEMELPSNDAPAVREYLDEMKKQYPADVSKDRLSWATELSWLGAKMFVEALKRAGPNPTRQGILNALDTMTTFDPGFYKPGYTIRPGPHDFVTCAKSAKLSASKAWVQYTDWGCL